MEDKILIYLISGFLGSGKTTFLQQLLEAFGEEKVGVIVNEFGAINIDGKVVEQNGVELREINNGSIFCSCLKSNFVKTLKTFAERPIRYLFIENSGMADPITMHTLLSQVNPYTVRPYVFAKSVCLVDSTSFLDYVDVIAPVQNQVAMADLILLNKSDLVTDSEIIPIREALRRINPGARIVNTSYAKLPMEILREQRTVPAAQGELTNHPWNRPVVYTLQAEGSYTRDQAEEFLKRWKGRALRLKGMIALEHGYVHLNMVEDQAQMEYHGKKLPGKSALVVFGKDRLEFRQELLEDWEACFGTVPKLYD